MMLISRRLLVIAAVLGVFVSPTGAQRGPLMQDPETLPLWTGPAPGALGTADEDTPTLTVYMPPGR